MIWFKRILGIIIILAAVIVIVTLLGAAYFFGPVLDQVSETVDNTLTLSVDSIETVSATLVQTQATLIAVSDSLDTAVQTSTNLSQTMADTIPLIEQVSVVISDQLPENIEAMQASIPNIATVAGVVDDALIALSNFGIEQTIPIPFNPITIDFDLGIDYAPEEPFDESIQALGTSLEGLPEDLRALRGELEVAEANLGTLSDDLLVAASDIQTLGTELAGFIPLIDQYLILFDQAIAGIEQLQAQLAANLGIIRLVGTVLPFALALTQLAPLVIGWQLLMSEDEESQVTVKEIPASTSLEDISGGEEVQAEREPGDTLIVAAKADTDSNETIVETFQGFEPEGADEEE